MDYKKLNEGLPDVQNEDKNFVNKEIYKVGINNYKVPIKLFYPGNKSHFNTIATVSAYASLPSDKKGVNMSRFSIVITKCVKDNISSEAMESILKELQKIIENDNVYVKFKFDYLTKVSAPESKIDSWFNIPVIMEGKLENGKIRKFITVEVNYTSLCPCCFLPNTLVYTKDDILEIENVNMCKTLENGNVEKTFIYPSEGKEYIEIDLMGLQNVKCSTDHEIQIWDKDSGKIEWKEAKDIILGDYVVVPKINHDTIKEIEYNISSHKLRKVKTNDDLVPDTIKIDENTAEMLGWFMAEGYANLNNSSICFSLNLEKEEKKSAFIEKVLQDKFNVNVYQRDYKHKNIRSTETYNYCVNDFFRKNFYNDKKEKIVPLFIQQSPKHIIRAFIKGWYDGDGSHTTTRKIQRLNTTSQKAAYQLQLLCMKLGEFVCVSKTLASNSNSIMTSDKVINKGGSVMIKDMYCIIFNQKFLYNQGFISENVTRNVNIVKSQKDYWCIPIRGIKDIEYEGEVYDLQVDKSQYTIPFIVHNSKDISQYGAHNQKSMARVKVELKNDMLLFEELKEIVDKSASCPIFNSLKRIDEKWVTEKAYENPGFTEDSCRKIAEELDKLLDNKINDYIVVTENYESIHQSHAVGVLTAGRELN